MVGATPGINEQSPHECSRAAHRQSTDRARRTFAQGVPRAAVPTRNVRGRQAIDLAKSPRDIKAVGAYGQLRHADTPGSGDTATQSAQLCAIPARHARHAAMTEAPPEIQLVAPDRDRIYVAVRNDRPWVPLGSVPARKVGSWDIADPVKEAGDVKRTAP